MINVQDNDNFTTQPLKWMEPFQVKSSILANIVRKKI